MRDRDRLGKLRSPYPGLIVLLLRQEAVHVEVKTAQVVAQQDRRALHKGAELKLWCGARIQPREVLAGDRRLLALAGQDDRLHAREDFTWPVARHRRADTVRER